MDEHSKTVELATTRYAMLLAVGRVEQSWHDPIMCASQGSKLLALALLLPNAASCNNHEARCPERQTAPLVNARSLIGEDKARELVVNSHKRLFKNLWLYSPVSKQHFKFQLVPAADFEVTAIDPRTWQVAWLPLAGSSFEAKVDRESGFVEWISVDFAAE